MTANMHLVLAVLAGLAALAMVIIMPSLKFAGITAVTLVLAYVLWRARGAGWWQ